VQADAEHDPERQVAGHERQSLKVFGFLNVEVDQRDCAGGHGRDVDVHHAALVHEVERPHVQRGEDLGQSQRQEDGVDGEVAVKIDNDDDEPGGLTPLWVQHVHHDTELRQLRYIVDGVRIAAVVAVDQRVLVRAGPALSLAQAQQGVAVCHRFNSKSGRDVAEQGHHRHEKSAKHKSRLVEDHRQRQGACADHDVEKKNCADRAGVPRTDARQGVRPHSDLL
jgi:hypothetical protein